MSEQNHFAAMFYNSGKHSPISGIHVGVDIFKQSGTDIIVRSMEKKEKLQKKKGRIEEKTRRLHLSPPRQRPRKKNLNLA
jgi:hypothetical protein